MSCAIFRWKPVKEWVSGSQTAKYQVTTVYLGNYWSKPAHIVQDELFCLIFNLYPRHVTADNLCVYAGYALKWKAAFMSPLYSFRHKINIKKKLWCSVLLFPAWHVRHSWLEPSNTWIQFSFTLNHKIYEAFPRSKVFIWSFNGVIRS